jgi:hypothetical protein
VSLFFKDFIYAIRPAIKIPSHKAIAEDLLNAEMTLGDEEFSATAESGHVTTSTGAGKLRDS